MKNISSNEQNNEVYDLKKYINKKCMILSVITILLAFIAIGSILYYMIDSSLRIKRTEEFISQMNQYNEEQIEIQKKIEKEKSKLPELTDVGRENMKNIYESEKKIAYLTFDDGPSNNTKDILDILNQNNIKATFFVLGSQVEYFPETTIRLYEEGHFIANHGYTHRYSSIYSSPQAVLDEYNRCNEIVARTIGKPEYNSHLFRFPGGSVGGKYATLKQQAITVLEQNNIAYIDWNSLTGDSEKQYPTAEYLMNNLQRTTENKNSLVILMHDSPAKRITVDVLQQVIDFLRQQGYEFENFYSIIK